MDETELIGLTEDLKLSLAHEEQSVFESDSEFESRMSKAKLVIESFDSADIEEFIDLVPYLKDRNQITKDDEPAVAGYMLEILYKKEMKSKEVHSEEAEEIINNQLRDILNSPFGVLRIQVRGLKRPDLVELIYDETSDKYLIKGAAEITHGLIGKTKFEQVYYYQEDIEKFLELFNEHPSLLSDDKYKDLREALNKIEVDQNFKVDLVMTAEKDISKEWEIYNELDNSQMDELRGLQEDDMLEIKRSVFSKEMALEIGRKIVTMHQVEGV